MDTTPLDEAIGTELRRIRRDRDLTQTDLAERSGVSEMTIWRIEKGQRSARVDQLAPLCDVLGVEPYDLIKAAMDNYRQQQSENADQQEG